MLNKTLSFRTMTLEVKPRAADARPRLSGGRQQGVYRNSPRLGTRHLVVLAGLDVELAPAGEFLHCLAELGVLDAVELLAGEVLAVGKGGESLAEKFLGLLGQVDEREEEVGALLEDGVVEEAAERCGIQEVLGVERSAGEVFEVEAGECVDTFGVAAKVEELRMLNGHGNDVL